MEGHKTIPTERFCGEVMMGLNKSYKAIKTQALLTKHFPSLNKVYSIIQ